MNGKVKQSCQISEQQTREKPNQHNYHRTAMQINDKERQKQSDV